MGVSRRDHPFRLRRGVVAVTLVPVLRDQLRQAAEIVLRLIEPGEDDLFPSTVAPDAPTDRAVARLFPSAYADAEAAAEFRRLTDGELRAGKRNDATRLRDTVDASTLELETAESWLRAINDARLIFASRLGIETDDDAERLYEGSDGTGDPAAAAGLLGYLNLGLIQEELISALG